MILQKLKHLEEIGFPKHAEMAESAAAKVAKYVQLSRTDTEALTGDCFKLYSKVFNTKARALVYHFQGEKRIAIFNLWMYKHSRDLNQSAFGYLIASSSKDLLKDSYNSRVPAGFSGACQKLRGASEADFDLLYDVLDDDNGALARELSQKSVKIEPKVLDFIKCQRPLRVSYSVAQILVRCGKQEDFARLVSCCSVTELSTLEKISKKQNLASMEELGLKLRRWREQLRFPVAVPCEPEFHERDGFKLIACEEDMRAIGRAFSNCLRSMYRELYSEEAHKGLTRLYTWQQKILFRISILGIPNSSQGTCSTWYLSELDTGQHPDLLEALKSELTKRGVETEPVQSAASAARRLADTNDWDFEL